MHTTQPIPEKNAGRFFTRFLDADLTRLRKKSDRKKKPTRRACAVAWMPESRVRKVKLEQPSLVEDGMRPGDVSFEFKDRLYAVNVFSVDSSASSNMDKGVEELFSEAVDEK